MLYSFIKIMEVKLVREYRLSEAQREIIQLEEYYKTLVLII